MIIRKINEDDAEMFLNMLRALDNETKNMMYEPGERKTTIDEIRARIKNTYDSDILILVVEDGGDLIGFISAERGFANRIKHSAYIVIGILERYRGKGIGAKLFANMEDWAKEKGVTRLELTVMTHNEGGIRLYENMGFKKEGLKEKSLIVDEEYVDEYYMARIIS